MRALVIHAPHDLRIDDVLVVQPGTGEVKVRVRMGGICGSDLHYFHNGGFGAIRIREPMSLGHEVAGTVTAIGSGVTCVAVGDKVAVNPSKPCGHCRFCMEGERQQCLDMRFFGSAMRFPHLQGAFREELIVDETQAVKVLPDTPFEEAAFSEPLSVALHAVSATGSLVGKRVLVTGAGTIGCLVIACARYAGAAEIVATDVSDNALAVAAKMGADRIVNVASDPGILDHFTADKGFFDAAFECSGNGGVIASLTQMVRPRGAITLVGMGAEVPLPISVLVTKELALHGSFRFDREFAWSVDLLTRRAIDVRPLLTGIFPLQDAVKAFEVASDKSKSMKVQIAFD
ncbi:L-idonate 5-dehydrogenase [Pleomorphomonas koreensis]|uniref:L-idonate 5-dehydrogenase n=1 Tax=Pleomorphomonas koreensis TaxID=257440 RepID=UPI00047A7221|nr:L-idonate 5-dehydrogenase [Pleomorphomonas koreensis]